ncbi:SIS domain-containing protein [Sporichthya polymorpha]|uniref:SIS domain-containing protein n=1 Tax=Sporichthya polymorpha TaxID=35751 RepID=UPI000376D10B|nr:SIS domain-containing protein [Sporichthya polymorpha]
MAVDFFDDRLLEDETALAGVDDLLRHLAEAGSRVRHEVNAATEAMAALANTPRPRAVVAAGSDARLLRAVLEPWCPVPFVAWPGPGLPGWAGALDLVVVIAPGGHSADAASAAAEAVRRGCGLLVSTPAQSPLAESSASRSTVLLPTQTTDVLAVAVVALQALHTLGLGPEVDAEEVAEKLVESAVACAPRRNLGSNPAKDLAVELAEAVPLVWGGSVLAARAGRRVAEAMRQASGRTALAADADHLIPVIRGAGANRRNDIFADPFEDGPAEQRPVLIVLDDGSEDTTVRMTRGRLLAEAEQNGVRHRVLSCHDGGPISRYASLLSTGQYAAVYLGLGLGRTALPAGDAS